MNRKTKSLIFDVQSRSIGPAGAFIMVGVCSATYYLFIKPIRDKKWHRGFETEAQKLIQIRRAREEQQKEEKIDT